MAKLTREDALLYHSQGKPGKIEVVPTKPYSSQRDLSLAYSPGVAEPCLEIEKDPNTAYEYTAKGNLVAKSTTKNKKTPKQPKYNKQPAQIKKTHSRQLKSKPHHKPVPNPPN
jgi:malic enzyme